jgi:mRNA interferase RelE/StbE
MAWKVRLTERAHKDLEKIDKQVAKRILSFFHDRIEGSDDPRSMGAALTGSELGEFWKYRIGDWRAICSIQDETVVVYVLTVQHRSEAYK